MLAPHILDLISTVLSYVRNCYLPFGGVQVLMTGDFLQLPPVIKPPRSDVKEAFNRWCAYYKFKEGEPFSFDDEAVERPCFAFESLAWTQLSPTCVTLNTIYRQSDQQFAALLARCRCGKPLNEDKEMLLRATKRYTQLTQLNESEKRNGTGLNAGLAGLVSSDVDTAMNKSRSNTDFASIVFEYPVEELGLRCEENVSCPQVNPRIMNLDECRELRRSGQGIKRLVPDIEYIESIHRDSSDAQDGDDEILPILSKKEQLSLVFPNHELNLPIFATELCAKLDTVAKANESGIRNLQGSSVLYSELIETDDKSNRTNFEKIAAPAMLELKVGAQVMLTVNVDVEAGLVNGSRGVVIGFADQEGRSLIAHRRHPDLESFVDRGTTTTMTSEKKLVMVASDAPITPVVLFFNGLIRSIGYYTWFATQKAVIKDSEIILAPHTLWYDDLNSLCVTGVKHQVPLCLAYAITIHKSQGASLDYAIVDLNGTFANGQAYVSISRVRSLAGLFMKSDRSNLTVSTLTSTNLFYVPRTYCVLQYNHIVSLSSTQTFFIPF